MWGKIFEVFNENKSGFMWSSIKYHIYHYVLMNIDIRPDTTRPDREMIPSSTFIWAQIVFFFF